MKNIIMPLFKKKFTSFVQTICGSSVKKKIDDTIKKHKNILFDENSEDYKNAS